MSRKNEDIREVCSLLDDLERMIHWNERWAFKPPADYNAVEALTEIMECFLKVRRVLDEVEAGVLDAIEIPDLPDFASKAEVDTSDWLVTSVLTTSRRPPPF